eukprot:1159115-Pelagomonas_calceolata.AAC.4
MIPKPNTEVSFGENPAMRGQLMQGQQLPAAAAAAAAVVASGEGESHYVLAVERKEGGQRGNNWTPTCLPVFSLQLPQGSRAYAA